MTKSTAVHRSVALIAAFAAWAWTVTASAQAPDAVRLIFTPAFTGHIPALLAADAGFFRKHGLAVQLIGTNEPIKPMITGDTDFALPAPAVAAGAAVQGVKLKIIMTMQSPITQAVLVQPDVAKAFKSPPGSFPGVIKELAGKRLGVTVRGGAVDINLRYMLLAAGLTPDRDVFVVPLGGGGQMVAAMKAKQIDGMLGFPPLSDLLVQNKEAVRVLDLAKGEGPPALNQPFIVVTVLDRFLEQKEPIVRRFVAAVVEAMAYIRDPRNAAEVKKQIAARLSGIDPGVIDGVIAELVATMNPTFTREDLAKVNEVQRKLGVLPRDATAEELMAEKLIPGRR